MRGGRWRGRKHDEEKKHMARQCQCNETDYKEMVNIMILNDDETTTTRCGTKTVGQMTKVDHGY